VEKVLPFLNGLIIPAVGKTSKFTNTLLKHAFAQAKSSLTKEQFIMLCHLEEGPKAQTSLAMITERDKGSLTRLVQTLERKQLVIKKCCEQDNRVNHVEITPKGKKVIAAAKPMVIEVFNHAQENIDKNDLEIALKVLEKLQKNVIETIENKEINH
jgi:DNA-binding MarR family transcriptional regulator